MTVRIIKGDVREKLAELPADHFDCIVTSPPYFGLRSYLPDGHPLKHFEIGLEPTLDAYLETIVAVCRELRRVLKPTGICFINIGDSYAANGCSGLGDTKSTTIGQGPSNSAHSSIRKRVPQGLKPKDLCLVPERLVIALQMDGWFVRSKIIWHKLNPMPESCQDRPTSAHETIWMLTKSARYFWDAEAVAEESAELTRNDNRIGTERIANFERSAVDYGVGTSASRRMARNAIGNKTNRNLRNVWSFASHPYPGAHFATFPPELAERCIKAGSSERGCCQACGAPWVRILNKRDGEAPANTIELQASGLPTHRKLGSQYTKWMNENLVKTIGWQPSCNCTPNVPHVGVQLAPSRILDPFAGAGTTGLVSDRLGRDCMLIDLSTEYAEMALNRIKEDAPLFVEVAAE